MKNANKSKKRPKDKKKVLINMLFPNQEDLTEPNMENKIFNKIKLLKSYFLDSKTENLFKDNENK